MKKNQWGVGSENDLPVYRQLQKVMKGKGIEHIDEMCESVLFEKGINVRFVPLEGEEDLEEFPSIVRSSVGKYSVGIPVMKFLKMRYYAKAVYVMVKEKESPGFFDLYLKNRDILTYKPYCFDILQIEYMFASLTK